jgi:hypothetical protein
LGSNTHEERRAYVEKACARVLRTFDALQAPAREQFFRRVREILTGVDTSKDFSNLSESDRKAILEILNGTKPEFAALTNADYLVEEEWLVDRRSGLAAKGFLEQSCSARSRKSRSRGGLRVRYHENRNLWRALVLGEQFEAGLTRHSEVADQNPSRSRDRQGDTRV